MAKKPTPQAEYAKLQKRAERGKLSPNQKKRLEAVKQQLGIGQQQVRTRVQSTLSAMPEQLLNVDGLTQDQRMDVALQYAASKNLIAIQDHGDPSAEKRCVVMGSSHKAVHENVGQHMSDITLTANHQLFALMHFMERCKVETPLIVEGTLQGRRPHEFVSVDLGDGTQKDIRTDVAQRHFVDNPEHFYGLSESMLRDGHDPNFFTLSSYPNIQGAHSQEVLDGVDEVLELQKGEDEFVVKYRPVDGGESTVRAEFILGKWVIFANGQWLAPEQVFDDAKKAIASCKARDAISEDREEEVLQHFQNASPDAMPMSWTGLAHVEPIKNLCLQHGMAVRTVVPYVESANHVPHDDRQAAIAMRDFALQQIGKNEQLNTH